MEHSEVQNLTDDEVLKHWNGLKRRHRTEVAASVTAYCIGRSMQEVATLLGYSRQWVANHLDHHSVAEEYEASESGGGNNITPHNTQDEVGDLVSKFAPEEPDPEYVDILTEQGHTPEVAKRLARACGAAENAQREESKESVSGWMEKRDALDRLSDSDRWLLDLQKLVSHVQRFVRFLDDANISDLERPETLKKVAKIHDRWIEQVDRVHNLHGEEMEDEADEADNWKSA